MWGGNDERDGLNSAIYRKKRTYKRAREIYAKLEQNGVLLELRKITNQSLRQSEIERNAKRLEESAWPVCACQGQAVETRVCDSQTECAHVVAFKDNVTKTSSGATLWLLH